MKRFLNVALIGLVSASCSTTNNKNSGTYGSAFVPIATNLKPTNEVAIHVSLTKEQYSALESRFSSLIKNNGWKVVGTATLYGSYYDTEKIENLAKSKGADTVLINIGRTPRITQKVSYGFGDYSQSNNYYGSPYVAPIIPPYQVAPAQGGLSDLMDFALKKQQYERENIRLQAERDNLNELRSEQQAKRQVAQMEWTQWLIFLRSPAH